MTSNHLKVSGKRKSFQIANNLAENMKKEKGFLKFSNLWPSVPQPKSW